MADSQRWSPERAVALALRYLGGLSSSEEALLARMASTLQEGGSDCLGDSLAQQSCAILFNVFEHVFSATIEQERRRLFEQQVGARVLDFGCGVGYQALGLALLGRQVTCVDTNPRKLDFVRWAGNELDLAARIDFEPHGSYDSVICINVLDHVEDPPALVTQLADLVRPGGDLFVYAHFTNDGVHVSDPEIITQTFKSLSSHFRRVPLDAKSAWVERWERPLCAADAAQEHPILDPALLLSQRGMDLVPRAHEDLRVRPLSGPSPAYRVDGSRFYLRPAQLGEQAASILRLCDGQRTTAAVLAAASGLGASAEQTRQTLLELWKRRFISLWEPRSAAG